MLQEQISDFLTYLKSVHTSQQFLDTCYRKNKVVDANKWSYENSYRFLYYLEHGLQFYRAGDLSSITVKPTMYFYGMVHLLKACLLTRKPNYPENTSMLAHGVSTRKRKKQQYAFLQDEVKLQHKGLFPYFSTHLFGVEQLPFDKINMDKLLVTIPELQNIYQHHRNEQVQVRIGGVNDKSLVFPEKLLDQYHMTSNTFSDRVLKHLPTIKNTEIVDNQFIAYMDKPLEPTSEGPFYFHMRQEAFYLPATRNYFSTVHEIMNHYLLLYNLSMICRYETEWWGDLLHTLPTEDYPFIEQFLTITAKKVPFLLGYFLQNENKDELK